MVKNGIYSFFWGLEYGKALLWAGSARAPKIHHPKTGRVSPVKQAHIEPKQAKEELKPFYTNFATG
jgi:hypothetical protein